MRTATNHAARLTTHCFKPDNAKSFHFGRAQKSVRIRFSFNLRLKEVKRKVHVRSTAAKFSLLGSCFESESKIVVGKISHVTWEENIWTVTVEMPENIKHFNIGDLLKINGLEFSISTIGPTSLTAGTLVESIDSFAHSQLSVGCAVDLRPINRFKLGDPLPWLWQSVLSYIDSIERRPSWDVPWTADTIVVVMLMWLVSFWVVGSWMIPVAAQLLGYHGYTYSMREMAFYHLATDILELISGILVLQRCLAPFQPLPEGWFPVKLRGGWVKEVVNGCLMFPVVHALARLNVSLLPQKALEAKIAQPAPIGDPVALFVYVIVVSVCAPIWEELIFRGFLLPSLTRYMPVWASIVASAVVFAVAHFQPQRMLPLLFLGIVIGAVFVRSKNLLASMAVHSLWNAYVFVELFLKYQG